MKTFTLTILAIFAFTFTNAQDKTLTEVNKGYYAYNEKTIKDDNHQTGFYKEFNGKLLRDGKWKQYINGNLVAEAKYSNDKLVALIIDDVEYTTKDLQIIRLKNRIKNLEISANQ